MNLSELCNKSVVTISDEDTVNYACKLLRDEHVGCLIVTDLYEGNCKPLGIITDRDIVVKVIAAGIKIEDVLVKDIMGEKFITADINKNIYEGLELMLKHGVRRMPLVNGSGHLEGIITLDDGLSHLSSELYKVTRTINMEQNREAFTQL